MTRLIKWTVLLLSLIVCIQFVSAISVTSVTVDPSGSLTPSIPVTVQFKVENSGVFPPSGEIQFFTELDNPKWTYTIIVNGFENLRPVMGGRTLAISGFELNYKASDKVSVRVNLEGVAPPVTQTSNKTMIMITEYDANGKSITSSQVEKTALVMTTPTVRGCYAIIANDPQFSVLGTSLRAAKLDTAFDSGSFTILAPTDTAFAQLPNGTISSLLKDPEGMLKPVLLNHIINQPLYAVDVVKLGEAKTVQGTVLKIDTMDGIMIGGAKVIKTDIVCKNGVIHVIDRVLVPPVTVKTATPTPSTIPQTSVTITFTRDLTIMPSTTVYIPVGGKVVWKNDDPFKPHGIAALDNPDPASLKYFDSAPQSIPYGKTLEVTFNEVGKYDYKTVFQPETTGTIIVTNGVVIVTKTIPTPTSSPITQTSATIISETIIISPTLTQTPDYDAKIAALEKQLAEQNQTIEKQGNILDQIVNFLRNFFGWK